MRDAQGGILYVGKAKKLKTRVQSYFRNSKSHTPKIQKLVKHLKDFDTINTDTEFEAFMLECQLIKQLKPHYNRMMKSPQSFYYIMVEKRKDLLHLVVTNTLDEQVENQYFGPFTSRGLVERAVHGLKDSFKINCSNQAKRNSACLNFSLGLCIGTCLGGDAVKQHNSILSKIVSLLEGTNQFILDELNQLMISASENFDFEAASKYRDTIDAVNVLLNKEKVIEFTEENNHIVVIDPLNERTMKLFLIHRTNVLYSEKYELEKINTEQLRKKIKSKILSYFKQSQALSSIEVSKDEIDQAQIIYSYLKSNDCNYVLIPGNWLDTEDSEEINDALLNLLKKLEVLQ